MSYKDPAKNREYAQNWYQANKERLRACPERAERNRTYAKQWRKSQPEKNMLTAAKSRAKRLGYDFNLELSDIVIPELCPILGIPVYFADQQHEGTPALDRRDNTKGYVKGNVQVISHKANRSKSDFTVDQIEALWNYVKDLKKLA